MALLIRWLAVLLAALWPACPAEAASEGPESAPAETPELIARLLEPRFGDWDELMERRVIRVLVAFNKTNFFIDRGRQRGVTADLLLEWEKALNEELRLGSRPLNVAAIPVSRDRLIDYLEQGRGDLAAANLTVTPERRERVDFTVPLATSVAEIAVTGPGGPALRTVEDLAGREVHVRRTSSYFESLLRLNASFRSRGLDEIEVVAASEYLETEDLLEMTHAGLLPVTVADDYLARFWKQIFPGLVLHEEAAVASGRQIAWAVRRGAPALKARADAFVGSNRKGTLLGNILIKRYFQSTKFVRRALDQEGRERFQRLVGLFREYGGRYGFDYLLVAAQAYQESGLDQSVVSPVGAVGIMQVLPSTAADPAVGIPDISTEENNIHAGTKYLRQLVDVYFDDPGIDEVNRLLFAFAGYNAGPNRVKRLRGEAAQLGYDDTVWFGNVERVVADKVGREPVQYVRNIFKYYTAYKLLEIQRRRPAP